MEPTSYSQKEHVPRTPFRSDAWIVGGWWAGIVLNGALWAMLFFAIPPGREIVNLHYTLYFGIDRVGPWWHLFFLPLAGWMFHVFHFLLAGRWHRRNYFLGRTLAVLSVVLQVILAGGGVLIVLMNRAG